MSVDASSSYRDNAATQVSREEFNGRVEFGMDQDGDGNQDYKVTIFDPVQNTEGKKGKKSNAIDGFSIQINALNNDGSKKNVTLVIDDKTGKVSYKTGQETKTWYKGEQYQVYFDKTTNDFYIKVDGKEIDVDIGEAKGPNENRDYWHYSFSVNSGTSKRPDYNQNSNQPTTDPAGASGIESDRVILDHSSEGIKINGELAKVALDIDGDGNIDGKFQVYSRREGMQTIYYVDPWPGSEGSRLEVELNDSGEFVLTTEGEKKLSTGFNENYYIDNGVVFDRKTGAQAVYTDPTTGIEYHISRNNVNDHSKFMGTAEDGTTISLRFNPSTQKFLPVEGTSPAFSPRDEITVNDQTFFVDNEGYVYASKDSDVKLTYTDENGDQHYIRADQYGLYYANDEFLRMGLGPKEGGGFEPHEYGILRNPDKPVEEPSDRQEITVNGQTFYVENDIVYESAEENKKVAPFLGFDVKYDGDKFYIDGPKGRVDLSLDSDGFTAVIDGYKVSDAGQVYARNDSREMFGKLSVDYDLSEGFYVKINGQDKPLMKINGEWMYENSDGFMVNAEGVLYEDTGGVWSPVEESSQRQEKTVNGQTVYVEGGFVYESEEGDKKVAPFLGFDVQYDGDKFYIDGPKGRVDLSLDTDGFTAVIDDYKVTDAGQVYARNGSPEMFGDLSVDYDFSRGFYVEINGQEKSLEKINDEWMYKNSDGFMVDAESVRHKSIEGEWSSENEDGFFVKPSNKHIYNSSGPVMFGGSPVEYNAASGAYSANGNTLELINGAFYLEIDGEFKVNSDGSVLNAQNRVAMFQGDAVSYDFDTETCMCGDKKLAVANNKLFLQVEGYLVDESGLVHLANGVDTPEADFVILYRKDNPQDIGFHVKHSGFEWRVVAKENGTFEFHSEELSRKEALPHSVQFHPLADGQVGDRPDKDLYVNCYGIVVKEGWLGYDDRSDLNAREHYLDYNNYNNYYLKSGYPIQYAAADTETGYVDESGNPIVYVSDTLFIVTTDHQIHPLKYIRENRFHNEFQFDLSKRSFGDVQYEGQTTSPLAAGNTKSVNSTSSSDPVASQNQQPELIETEHTYYFDGNVHKVYSAEEGSSYYGHTFEEDSLFSVVEIEGDSYIQLLYFDQATGSTLPVQGEEGLIPLGTEEKESADSYNDDENSQNDNFAKQAAFM